METVYSRFFFPQKSLVLHKLKVGLVLFLIPREISLRRKQIMKEPEFINFKARQPNVLNQDRKRSKIYTLIVLSIKPHAGIFHYFVMSLKLLHNYHSNKKQVYN